LTAEEKGSLSEVTSVKLWASRRPGIEFLVRQTANPDSSQKFGIWETVVQEEGKPTIQRQVAPKPRGDEYLLGDQLNLPGHDPVFEEALKSAVEMSYW
jgi:hypothetical protein